ncbi:MAG: substrate-binding domain-containing protein [Spirochaetia bacterium]|nr:substrate-binding domain-containing protein [Spirochaetia bacterium]MCF7945572.1 substrate-binding domain-containing protein [Spirochaetia bacterium]
MPKSRTEKVTRVKQKLIDRIESGFYKSGERFLSNREIASLFNISYLTSHKLLKELEEEGYLGRKKQSGSFVKGSLKTYEAVGLYVSERAFIESSYSAYLLNKLEKQLSSLQIPYHIVDADVSAELADELYPIMLNTGFLQKQLYKKSMYGFLLNDEPEPGLSSIWVDSITIDNYSGGFSAGQILNESFPENLYILFAGPEDDSRSRKRAEGFIDAIPEAYTVYAESWHYNDAYQKAPGIIELFNQKEAESFAVFCCNDKLASAVFDYCVSFGVKPPMIMGFDNMPVSEEMNFSTMAIPWNDMINHSISTAQARLSGDTGPARHVVLHTYPLIRKQGR